MDDHFWPSLYPGLVIGLLVGITSRSLVGTFAGALGGLAGAYAGYWLVLTLGLGGDVLPLVAVIAGAAAGSQAFVWMAGRMAVKSG
ncbi:MAG: hypothetical protein NW216_11550 [Hyphomicrobium sp.]|nr:hypothetical protein [Hyphomicrobium sp.]